ncbi:phosphoesterase, MJ0936 family [Dyella sp. OK004]|uniref:metallophosphoesterase family protein n=1 Tax=Dyella sp. OK004 TaxID=1855292 RepID=UPI0008F0EA70|nr:YfcE family phosphodiesterase [Dyella sp. OK004]SFS13885.1 phosphoesterase, MJ0936 family [Dyella sp. OK004]
MKVVIVSDLHGNYDAWSHLPEENYDELWVLGDLVNYGPEPEKIVEEMMTKAHVIVRGNHDQAVAYEDDSTWSPRYRELATASRRHTSSVLSAQQKNFLRDLPLQATREQRGTVFHMVHATPSNPMYGRLAPDADAWLDEIESTPGDVLLVGHSHIPFVRTIGNKVLLNPGSLGQPRSGGSDACYATWEGGKFSLKSYPYPVDTTIRKIEALALAPPIVERLTTILRTGYV